MCLLHESLEVDLIRLSPLVIVPRRSSFDLQGWIYVSIFTKWLEHCGSRSDPLVSYLHGDVD
jgi:hypothetical protein